MELQEQSQNQESSFPATLRELFGHSPIDQVHDESVLHPVPTLPFILSFHNLSYSLKIRCKIFPTSFTRSYINHDNINNGETPPQNTIENNNKSRTRVLLNDISGEAKEGEIMAVLGVSGSGKSTLIDALADRIAKDSLEGTISLNGEVLESKLLKVISAYVMQDDLLFPMLTVEETLNFSAEFRLPRTMSAPRKRARVQALIDQLGLRSAAKTLIGDEGHRGVSGGERRRVSIGTDTVHDPILLFLDEPTSGLDSTSAYMVVKVLKRIAQCGSIVIMSIHQPSYRILSLLDKLLILSLGETVFSGSPGDLPRFFAEFGSPIPANEDKAEFALDCVMDLEATPEGTKNLVDFNKKWQKLKNPDQDHDGRNSSNEEKIPLKDAIREHCHLMDLDSTLSSSSVHTYANPFWKEMIVIANRSITNSRRAPEVFGMRFGAVLVTGILLATVFWRLDNSPKGVQERLGFFAFAMSTAFYTCAEAIPVFLLERYIFMRETAYNAYRHSSYVLSHSIISIPSLLFLSLTFAATTYWAVGLGDGGGASNFLFFFTFVFASFWVGNSFVTFLSGVIYNVMVAYTIVIAILAYFVLFSGLFITRDRIPPYWIWFHYASLVKYPYQGVLQNEFGDPSRCFVKGLQVFDVTPLRSVPDSVKVKMLESMSKTLGMNITSSTCLTTGSDVLKQSGATDIDKWSSLWITLALGFLFRVLFYFALLAGSKKNRRS